jgi:hypothetical protein
MSFTNQHSPLTDIVIVHIVYINENIPPPTLCKAHTHPSAYLSAHPSLRPPYAKRTPIPPPTHPSLSNHPSTHGQKHGQKRIILLCHHNNIVIIGAPPFDSELFQGGLI